MTAVSAASLVDVLRQLRLLEPGQLEETARDLQIRFRDPKALAGELVRRGWLTPYQINQLLQGHGADLLLGSYVLLERLGEGGMGQVFKACHQKMGRVVALKLIRKDRLTNPDTVRRFEREIRAAAQLAHPNVVTAHDAARVGDTLLATQTLNKSCVKTMDREGEAPRPPGPSLRQSIIWVRYLNATVPAVGSRGS